MPKKLSTWFMNDSFDKLKQISLGLEVATNQRHNDCHHKSKCLNENKTETSFVLQFCWKKEKRK